MYRVKCVFLVQLIVTFHAVQLYICIASVKKRAFYCFSLTHICCLKITKYTHIRDFPLLETSLFFLMSYATFLAAEAAELTGECALLFVSICSASAVLVSHQGMYMQQFG